MYTFCENNPSNLFCQKAKIVNDTHFENNSFELQKNINKHIKFKNKFQKASPFKQIPTIKNNDFTSQKTKDQSAELLNAIHTDFKKLPNKVLNNFLGENKIEFDNPTQKKYALAAYSAYAFSYNNKAKLNKIMKELPNFQIDPLLSGRNSVTLVNTLNKEVIIAYRGSDAEFFKFDTIAKDPNSLKNVEDWYVNLLTSIGNQR